MPGSENTSAIRQAPRGRADTGQPRPKLTDAAKLPRPAEGLPFTWPEHRLLSKRFRQYGPAVKGSAEWQARRAAGLPTRPFLARYERAAEDKDGQAQEIITPILHGTLSVPEGAATLYDVDDREADDSGAPASRGRPGRILDKILTVRYLPDSSAGNIADVPPVRISDHELRDLKTPQWPSRLGIHGEYAIMNLAAVVDAISAMSRSVPARIVYAKTGVLRRPGQPPVWLRFGGPALMPAGSATATDDTARAELHPEYESVPVLRELSYSMPSTDATAAGDLAALYSALPVYPETPELPVVLVSELGWAPFSSDLGRVSITVYGDSGEAGKTSILDAVIVSAQSATHQAGPEVEGLVFNCRNKGTGLGLDQAMHPARGSIVAADDIITRNMSPQELTKALTKLDAILDGIATGSGSPRGGYSRGRASFNVNKAPTGCAAVTAEDIPGEDRLVYPMGRTAAVAITNPADPDQWSKALTTVQEHSREIARAHSRFIVDHLADLEATGRAAFAEFRPVVAGWLREHGGHKRTVNTYARLAAGWALYARHEARLTGQDPGPREAHGLAVLRAMFVAQAARSGKILGARPMTDQAELWVRSVSSVLSGALYVADPELGPDGLYQPPRGLSPAEWPRLGWRPRPGQGALGPVWEPITAGPPVGAVLVRDPEAAGRRPCFDMRLVVRPADFDRLTSVAADRASKGPVPLVLSGGPVLRDKLVAAGALHRKDPESQGPIWGESGNQRRFVVDLGPILAGTLGQHDAEPPPTEPDSPADPAEPGPAPDACGLCGEPTSNLIGGEPWHPWCAEPEPEPGAESGADLVDVAEADLVDVPAVAPCPGCSLPLPDGEGLTIGGYHVCCAPQDRPEPAPEPEPEPAAAMVPGDDQDQAPEPAQAVSEPPAEVPEADELAYFAKEVRKVDEDATDADIAAGLNIFHEVTGGVRFLSYAGQVGQAWFSMLAAKHASMKRPEALTSPILAEITGTAPLTRVYFVDKPKTAIRPGKHFVTSYDANGQFPAAAGSTDLGDGEPVTVDKPRSIDGLVNLPGYVKIASQLRTGHPAFGVIPAGRWVAMPLVKFLVKDLGLTVPADQVVYWPKHGRRLSAYIGQYRKARERLMSAKQTGPVRAALIGLKSQANVFISMFNSPTYSHGGFYRPDWNHMIVATAEANALRHFYGPKPKCKVAPVAKMADAVYFVADKDEFVPDGLEISDPLRPEPGKPIGQLGKWKPDRHGPVTDELIKAIRDRQPASVRDAVIRIDAERQATP